MVLVLFVLERVNEGVGGFFVCSCVFICGLVCLGKVLFLKKIGWGVWKVFVWIVSGRKIRKFVSFFIVNLFISKYCFIM